MFVQVGEREGVTHTAAYPLVRADAVPSAVSGLGGCGCSGIRSVGNVNPDGLGMFGTNPDGLGTNPDGLGDCPPLMRSVTGNVLFDGVVGGAIGFLLSPVHDSKERMLWAAGGAAATSLTGIFGLMASVGLAIWVRKPKTT